MTLIWPSKFTKGQTDYATWFATHDFLSVFPSIYSALLHRNPVFQQMTLIWPFKVTKGQTDYAIRFATYVFLLWRSLTDTARKEFLNSEDAGNEELTKIHKTQSSVPTSFCNTGSWPSFWRSLEHSSFEKKRKMDSLTSKTLRMINYLLWKVSIVLYSSSKCWLISRKTNIRPSQGQGAWLKPNFTYFPASPWQCAPNRAGCVALCYDDFSEKSKLSNNELG